MDKMRNEKCLACRHYDVCDITEIPKECEKYEYYECYTCVDRIIGGVPRCFRRNGKPCSQIMACDNARGV